MTPSEVRDYIGRQHLQLRIFFVEVENSCRDSVDSSRVDSRPLILKLVRAVSDHITVEDRTLLPTLRQIDAWGSVRADEVAAEHHRQREKLAWLRTLAHGGNVVEAAQAALALIRELMADMDVEERDLLGANLLRDDVVVINQSDG